MSKKIIKDDLSNKERDIAQKIISLKSEGIPPMSDEYIADLLLGLIRLTRSQNSNFLNYLLHMAHREASAKQAAKKDINN